MAVATFKIEGDHIELTKLLKATGLCETGGTAKTAIAEGCVRVDGHVELRKRCKIKKGQVVELSGKRVTIE